MALRLENFKSSIPETILKRGHSYYRNNHVMDLSYDNGVWDAQVSGSELYDVQIEQQANGSLTWDCTCPYAETDLCKHVVAVLYAIETKLLKTPNIIKSSDPKKPSKKDMLREALQAASHEQLVEMLMNWAAKDRTFADQILLRLGVKNSRPDDYVALVKAALRQSRDRNDGYMNGRHVALHLDSLIEQANENLAQGRPMIAVAICLAITEECSKVLNEVYDPDGELSGMILGAVEVIENCVPALGPADKKTLFELCLEHSSKGLYSHWDWEWSFYDMAADLVTTPEEREQLFKALDARPDHGNRWNLNYDEEAKARVKLRVIERLDDPETADAFLNANAHLDRFRQTLIQNAIKKQQIPRAIELTMQGIQSADERKLPGLVLDYQRLLVNVAVEQKDATVIARMIPPIWLQRGDEDLYKLLKRNVPADDWPAFLKKELIEKLRPGDPRAAWIYKREGMWKDLLQIVRQHPGSYLSSYQKDLEAEFPEEMCELYAQLAFRTAQDAGSRESYKVVCNYLYRMQHLGEEERVIEIIEQLKTQYPRRKALLEELKQL